MNGVYAHEAVLAAERLVRDLSRGTHQVTVREWLGRQAQRVLEAHRKGDTACGIHISNWHPDHIGRPVEEIMAAAISVDDVRLALAREYGFQDWEEVESTGDRKPEARFETAVDAVVTGDVAALTALIDDNPNLVHARSCYGHGATLLHYVGSNGVETHRQKVPSNLASVARLLINRGADVQARANMYGGQYTALELLMTSAHPKKAGVTEDVARVLRDAGKGTDA